MTKGKANRTQKGETRHHQKTRGPSSPNGEHQGDSANDESCKADSSTTHRGGAADHPSAVDSPVEAPKSKYSVEDQASIAWVKSVLARPDMAPDMTRPVVFPFGDPGKRARVWVVKDGGQLLGKISEQAILERNEDAIASILRLTKVLKMRLVMPPRSYALRRWGFGLNPLLDVWSNASPFLERELFQRMLRGHHGTAHPETWAYQVKDEALVRFFDYAKKKYSRKKKTDAGEEKEQSTFDKDALRILSMHSIGTPVLAALTHKVGGSFSTWVKNTDLFDHSPLPFSVAPFLYVPRKSYRLSLRDAPSEYLDAEVEDRKRLTEAAEKNPRFKTKQLTSDRKGKEKKKDRATLRGFIQMSLLAQEAKTKVNPDQPEFEVRSVSRSSWDLFRKLVRDFGSPNPEYEARDLKIVRDGHSWFLAITYRIPRPARRTGSGHLLVVRRGLMRTLVALGTDAELPPRLDLGDKVLLIKKQFYERRRCLSETRDFRGRGSRGHGRRRFFAAENRLKDMERNAITTWTRQMAARITQIAIDKGYDGILLEDFEARAPNHPNRHRRALLKHLPYKGLQHAIEWCCAKQGLSCINKASPYDVYVCPDCGHEDPESFSWQRNKFCCTKCALTANADTIVLWKLMRSAEIDADAAMRHRCKLEAKKFAAISRIKEELDDGLMPEAIEPETSEAAQ